MSAYSEMQILAFFLCETLSLKRVYLWYPILLLCTVVWFIASNWYRQIFVSCVQILVHCLDLLKYHIHIFSHLWLNQLSTYFFNKPINSPSCWNTWILSTLYMFTYVWAKSININHNLSRCNVRVVYLSSRYCLLVCVSIWFWYTTTLLTHILWV